MISVYEIYLALLREKLERQEKEKMNDTNTYYMLHIRDSGTNQQQVTHKFETFSEAKAKAGELISKRPTIDEVYILETIGVVERVKAPVEFKSLKYGMD